MNLLTGLNIGGGEEEGMQMEIWKYLLKSVLFLIYFIVNLKYIFMKFSEGYHGRIIHDNKIRYYMFPLGKKKNKTQPKTYIIASSLCDFSS